MVDQVYHRSLDALNGLLAKMEAQAAMLEAQATNMSSNTSAMADLSAEVAGLRGDLAPAIAKLAQLQFDGSGKLRVNDGVL